MLKISSPFYRFILVFVFCYFFFNIARVAHAEVSFSRDVLPILSDRCFHCHGPDEGDRKAKLRLDDEEDAKRLRKDYRVITPGNLERSVLWERVSTKDPDDVMPPKDSHRKPLNERELAIIKEWILKGAVWGKHWAFEVPQKPKVPEGHPHPVDAFVKERLKGSKLKFSKPAEKHTQLRRLSSDLTGLPPSYAEVQSFEKDSSPDAYLKHVDRFLKSPHFGERMAVWWLDAARYSDTDGYQADSTRANWPWRDWVVDAFNKNMPFDQFTIEQFAGDLLPNATKEQILATCFNRNHMTNGEGGRLAEESRIDYVIDRVNTMGTVFMGLTLGCCQCHSHKFDPISQKEYYSLFAFFNSIDEDGRAGGGAKPFMTYKSPQAPEAVKEMNEIVERRKKFEKEALAQAQEEFIPWLAEANTSVRRGFKSWHILDPHRISTVEGTQLKKEVGGVVQAIGPNPFQDDYRLIASTQLKRVTGLRLEVFPHKSHTNGMHSRGQDGRFVLTDVKLQVRRKGSLQFEDVEIAQAIADAERNVGGRNYGRVRGTLDDDPRNGWTTEAKHAKEKRTAIFALDEPLSMAEGDELIFVLLHRSTRGDANIGRFRVSVSDQPGDAVRSFNPMPMESLATLKLEDLSKLDPKIKDRLFKQFLSDHTHYQRVRDDLSRAQRQLNEVKKAAGNLKVMVLGERKDPRKTHVLVRGVWDKKGEVVPRSFPKAVLTSAKKESLSRLDLAEWLVSKKNPLTARVIANHLWQLCFGTGLVRTPEDFGLQGEKPTHPLLLDWLAVELIESEWNIKHLLKLIVTSDTYRQSSVMSQEQLELDPDNRQLARGSRFRLPSWMIRDAVLKSSGLLNPRLGGPTVKPYQPPGVWQEIFMGRFRYDPSQGESQFRRTIYAFWRRAAAPTFLFDSAQRRVCEVRPRRTNTPLHALTLLNDLSILEASRHLARRASILKGTTKDRLQFAFQEIVLRTPTEAELNIMEREYQRAKESFTKTRALAHQLLSFGQAEHRGGSQPIEVASLLVVTNMIYNLDEAITHE